MRGEYSLSDIAAVTGNSGNNDGNGFGGNGAWWIIVLIALFGRGGFGNFGGGNEGGSSSTPQVVYGGLGMPDIYGKLDGISNGICDATFALNNAINNGFFGVQNALTQGFGGLNTALLQGNYALSSQLANCCCDIRAGIQNSITQGVMNTNSIQSQIASCCCDLEKMNLQNRFDAQTYNCNTLQAIDKLGDRIINRLTQDKIDTLQSENQSLRLAASQADQNAVLRASMDANTAELIRRLGADCPQPAYLVNGPTPISFPTNCCGQVQFANNNCGCGCSCGNY